MFVGKHLLDRAEWYGLIDQELLGIRKNHTAINKQSTRVLTFNVVRNWH